MVAGKTRESARGVTGIVVGAGTLLAGLLFGDPHAAPTVRLTAHRRCPLAEHRLDVTNRRVLGNHEFPHDRLPPIALFVVGKTHLEFSFRNDTCEVDRLRSFGECEAEVDNPGLSERIASFAHSPQNIAILVVRYRSHRIARRQR